MRTFYPKKTRGDLGRFRYLQEIEIFPNSVFAEQDFLQHAGIGWKGHHALRYHIFVKPVGYSLIDAVAFVYGDSLKVSQSAKS